MLDKGSSKLLSARIVWLNTGSKKTQIRIENGIQNGNLQNLPVSNSVLDVGHLKTKFR